MKSAPQDVYFSAQFFYYILKSMGLASYQFDAKTQTLKVSCKNYWELIFSIFVWIFLSWITWRNFEVNNMDTGVQSKFLDGLWKDQYKLQHILPIFTILFNFLKRKNIENFLKLIFNFDQTMQRVSNNFNVRHSRCLILGLYLTSAFGIMIQQIIMVYYRNIYGVYGSFDVEVTKILRIFTYFAISEFYFMISMQFIMSVWYINVRLTTLTKHIR